MIDKLITSTKEEIKSVSQMAKKEKVNLPLAKPVEPYIFKISKVFENQTATKEEVMKIPLPYISQSLLIPDEILNHVRNKIVEFVEINNIKNQEQLNFLKQFTNLLPTTAIIPFLKQLEKNRNNNSVDEWKFGYAFNIYKQILSKIKKENFKKVVKKGRIVSFDIPEARYAKNTVFDLGSSQQTQQLYNKEQALLTLNQDMEKYNYLNLKSPNWSEDSIRGTDIKMKDLFTKLKTSILTN